MTNVLDGGENPPKLTGIPKSEECKRKIGESNKKFIEAHPEQRIIRSENMKSYLKTDAGKEFSRKSLEAKRKPEFREAQRKRSIEALNTKEFHERHSLKMKEVNNRPEMIARHVGKRNHNAQSVKQYDLDGNLIKEYETITQAFLDTGVSISKISAVAKGRRKTAGGYVWKFSNDKNITLKRDKKYFGNPSCEKVVCQYDMNGIFLHEYKSIAEATVLNGFNNRTNIICNLKGRTKSAYGYIWKYKQGNTVPSLK